MSTAAQIAANRNNAALSTGPRTIEGKSASRYNRMRHGLASPLTVLPFENQDDYNNVYASFCEEYSPAGPTEEALVKQVADSQWKLRRVDEFEQRVFSAMLADSRNEPNSPAADPYDLIAASLLGPGKHQQALNSLQRYQSSLSRQFLAAIKELRNIQELRRAAEDESAKLVVVHQLTGLTERTQSERSAMDLLAADPEILLRYIDAESNALSASARSRQQVA